MGYSKSFYEANLLYLQSNSLYCDFVREPSIIRRCLAALALSPGVWLASSLMPAMAQSRQISGCICDRPDRKPLAYAAVWLRNSETGAICNQRGNFRLVAMHDNDTLVISVLGYNTQSLPLHEFSSGDTLFLIPRTNELRGIQVSRTTEKNFASKLFFRVVEKYRNKTSPYHTTMFMTASTFCNEKPTELLEAFYQAQLSLSSGLQSCSLVSGRYGQMPDKAFLSLNISYLMRDFNIFERNPEMLLPAGPCNYSYPKMKSLFRFSLGDCGNCEPEMVHILFDAAYPHLFSGEIWFNASTLDITKLSYHIEGKVRQFLAPINPEHSISINSIEVTVNFNPRVPAQISYMTLNYQLDYRGSDLKRVQTMALLYFYPQGRKPAVGMYKLTQSFVTDNDYSYIMLAPEYRHFWNCHYLFTEDSALQATYKHFIENGVILNYHGHRTDKLIRDAIAYPLVEWSPTARIGWQHLRFRYPTHMLRNAMARGSLLSDPGRFDHLDVFWQIYRSDTLEKPAYFSRTLLNMDMTYFYLTPGCGRMAYLNMEFDIFEKYRRKADSLTKGFDDEAKVWREYEHQWNSAVKEAACLAAETERGELTGPMVLWNERIRCEVGTDNLMQVVGASITSDSTQGTVLNCMSVGSEYLKRNENAIAIQYFTAAIRHCTLKNILRELFYKRAIALEGLGFIDRACIDYAEAKQQGHPDAAGKLRKLSCGN